MTAPPWRRRLQIICISRSELDWLIYNAPLDYADLVLNGDPEKYLNEITVYKPLEN